MQIEVPFDQEQQDYLPFDDRDFVIAVKEAHNQRRLATEQYNKSQSNIFKTQERLTELLDKYFLKAGEVGDLLSIPRSTLNLHLKQGKIPGLRLSGKWYITRLWVYDQLR